MPFDRNAYQREYMRQRRERERNARPPLAASDPNAPTPRQLAQRQRRLREAQQTQTVSVSTLSSLADRVLAHVLARGGQVVGPAGVYALLAEMSLSVEDWTRAFHHLCAEGRAHVQEPADLMGERKFIFTA